MNLVLSAVLSLYIIYVLNYFKTTYSIAHPITYFNNKYMFHPIYNTKSEKSMICQFGHDASWMLAFFILFRYLVIKKNKLKEEHIKIVSMFVLLSVLLVSLVNLNAVLYLIPYYIIEICYIKKII